MTKRHRRASRLAVASLLWAFLLLDACGGKVDAGPNGTGAAPNDGGGSGGTASGGTGGVVPTGGTGGVIPSGGTGGVLPTGGTSGTCGANCPSYKLAGLLEVPACCASFGQCGAAVTKTVGDILVLPADCYPLAQQGIMDPSCPDLDYVSPLDGKPYKYPACCQIQTGTCGVLVDLTSKQGPDLGCANVAAGGAGLQPCGGPPDCGSCVQTACNAELAACSSNNECMAIIQCASACTDQICVDQCIASHPAGKPGFYAIDSCVNAKCASQCQ